MAFVGKVAVGCVLYSTKSCVELYISLYTHLGFSITKVNTSRSVAITDTIHGGRDTPADNTRHLLTQMSGVLDRYTPSEDYTGVKTSYPVRHPATYISSRASGHVQQEE